MSTRYRKLTASEIEQLERAGNYAEDWSAILVADPFCVECLRNNTFDGEVHLGALTQGKVQEGDLTLHFYNTRTGKTYDIPRASQAKISKDGKKVVFRIAPAFQEIIGPGKRLSDRGRDGIGILRTVRHVEIVLGDTRVVPK